MTPVFELWEHPQAEEIYLIVGWRQWADAGAVSSGLPQYLVQQLRANQIGLLPADGYYLFQIPGTHDLVRPTVRFSEGYPESLEMPRNELFYSGDAQRGLAIFIGDEPHLNIESYIGAILQLAKDLGVKRIIGLGGVYGELPYDKERPISANYSLRRLKREVERLGVDLSEYHGGASVGAVLCRRAGERRIPYVGLYAFVPAYDFSSLGQEATSIRLENDFIAWLGIMRRVVHMLKLDLHLGDLEQRSRYLIQVVNDRVDEMERANPTLGVRDYLRHLTDEFTEVVFNPDDHFWEEKLKGLLDRFDGSAPPEPAPPEPPDEPEEPV